LRIFVAGGAGFIGSHLVDYLLRKNRRVTVYDNFSSGRMIHLRHHLNNSLFRLVEGDLLDKKKLFRSLRGHHFVFHLAANPDIRAGIKKTDLDLEQGTLITYRILEAMRIRKINRIAFTSSSVVYGETSALPIPEDFGPLQPISLYGAGKLASEALLTAFSGTFGFQVWIFRLANIVGTRMTHGILYDFRRKIQENPSLLEILGDGRQAKSYLHVSECIEAMNHVISHARKKINVFNIGPGETISVREIARLFLRSCGLKNTRLLFSGEKRGWPGDIPRFLLSVKKLEKSGWLARRTSREAVLAALEELKKCRR